MSQEQLQELRTLAATIADAFGYPPASRLDYLRRAMVHVGELLTAVLTNDQHFVMASLEEIALWLLLALPEQVPPNDLFATADSASADEVACVVSRAYTAHVNGDSYLPIAYPILYALRSVAAYPGFDLPATLHTKTERATRMRGILPERTFVDGAPDEGE